MDEKNIHHFGLGGGGHNFVTSFICLVFSERGWCDDPRQRGWRDLPRRERKRRGLVDPLQTSTVSLI